MIKKVCKKESSVLLVLYLIILKYLIKNRESTFTLYLYFLIFGSSFQEKEEPEITENPEQENKDDTNLSGKSPYCEEDFSVLDGGSYYYNARWYDPNLGGFITEDPIKDGGNWFIYANNSPLVFIDSTELMSDAAKQLKMTF